MSDSPMRAHGSGWRALSLGIGLLLMLGGSIYPFLLAGRSGTVDHRLLLALWAMSAGLVNGVGFTPRGWLWRGLLSGWACLLAGVLALLSRWIG